MVPIAAHGKREFGLAHIGIGGVTGDAKHGIAVERGGDQGHIPVIIDSCESRGKFARQALHLGEKTQPAVFRRQVLGHFDHLVLVIGPDRPDAEARSGADRSQTFVFFGIRPGHNHTSSAGEPKRLFYRLFRYLDLAQ
ncbi:MAG: hypothetical protein ABSG66_04490 [Stellaceae bacterium]